MFNNKETEYQYHPVIIKIIEDKPGGGTLAKADFPADSKEAAPGIVVGEDSNGLLRAIKTAKITATAAANATTYTAAGHSFKVNDFVTKDGLAGAAVKVTAVTTDTFTVSATMTAAASGDIIVQAKAAADAGSAALVYTPIGVSMSKVDLTVDNQPTGVLIRGSVNKAQMPMPLSVSIAAKLPLILFN